MKPLFFLFHGETSGVILQKQPRKRLNAPKLEVSAASTTDLAMEVVVQILQLQGFAAQRCERSGRKRSSLFCLGPTQNWNLPGFAHGNLLLTWREQLWFESISGLSWGHHFIPACSFTNFWLKALAEHFCVVKWPGDVAPPCLAVCAMSCRDGMHRW